MRNVFKKIALLLGLCALVLGLCAGTDFGAVAVRAEEGPVLKLHYHRQDGNYTDWDVWLWEYGKDGAGYAFANEGGDMVATMNVTPGVTSIGFIVRTAGWAQKDIAEDQFIDIAEVVSGTIHVYVESGVKGYTKGYGEDTAVGIKVKSAKYDTDGTITVTMTGTVDNFAEAFTVHGREGDVVIDNVQDNGNQIYTLICKDELDLTSNYMITYEGTDYGVTMPNIYSNKEFEEMYTYTGNDLGANWSKESTFFRVWAPTANNVYVNLYESGTEGSEDLLKSVAMTQDVNGTWTATVNQDLNGVYYTYQVDVNGEKVEAVDPYARTTGINGKRGMIIDLDSTDPAGWDNDKNPHAGERITDAIIYEGHIRDLTVNSDGGVSNRGKYIGLIETGLKTPGGSSTGVDHLKELGITHLHIMPMYDFGSVDETSPINKYNWGYDPVNYNVPEGSYSTDPYNGEVRVAEVKQMVQGLHNNGISVVMDVVYNHVESAAEFCFNRIVPGYFSRMNEGGSYSNGSGCGNDTASERSMVSKYIVDSVNYWVEEYHIDGFRFDLVGLLDTDTINEIVNTVHAAHPDVIFYGEGWTLTTTVTKDNVKLATQTNSTLTPGFAYFNDTIRDGLKGSVFDTGKGFISGSAGDKPKVERSILGADNWCKSPSQTINYASCHDNNTLYDRLKLSCKDADEADIIKMNNLAAAIYMTSEGIPFMASGEEMLRSKQNKDGTYDSNSYKSGDTVNSVKWANLDNEQYREVFEYYKGLIAFRKAHSVLRLATADEVARYVQIVSPDDSDIIAVQITGGPSDETAEGIYMIFNRGTGTKELSIPDGEWNIYAQGAKAGTVSLGTVSGKVSVEPISALILAKGVKETENKDTAADTDTKNNSVSGDNATTDGNPYLGEPGDNQYSGPTILYLLIAAIAVIVIIAVAGFAVKRRKSKK